MPRRNDHFLHALARAPWPFGMVAGIGVLLLGKVVVSALLAASGNPFLAKNGVRFTSGKVIRRFPTAIVVNA